MQVTSRAIYRDPRETARAARRGGFGPFGDGRPSLRDVEGVSVPTFTFIDEAWVAIHRVTSPSRFDAVLSTGACAFGAP